jgi:hypothetical protein
MTLLVYADVSMYHLSPIREVNRLVANRKTVRETYAASHPGMPIRELGVS